MEEIDRFVQKGNLDRSVYLREILKKGFSLDKMERMFDKYATGELSLMEVCHALKMNSWQFFEELKAKNRHLNVGNNRICLMKFLLDMPVSPTLIKFNMCGRQESYPHYSPSFGTFILELL